MIACLTHPPPNTRQYQNDDDRSADGNDAGVRCSGCHHITIKNLAVESAARHATDLGLGVRIVEDMCASSSSQLHDFAMANTLPLFAEIVSSNDAITLLSDVR